MVRHAKEIGERVLAEALHSTKTLSQHEDLCGLEERLGLLEPALDAEGDHAAESARLLEHHRIARVRRETCTLSRSEAHNSSDLTRVDHILNLLAVLEVQRHGESVLLVALHAHWAV